MYFLLINYVFSLLFLRGYSYFYEDKDQLSSHTIKFIYLNFFSFNTSILLIINKKLICHCVVVEGVLLKP